MQTNENNVPASCKGPPENVHVPNYKEAMATFSIPCNKEKWSKEERENLLKGVKQQFQEILLQQCVDRLKYDFTCSVNIYYTNDWIVCLPGMHSCRSYCMVFFPGIRSTCFLDVYSFSF